MKRVFNLIIVDESGSMSVIQKQALSGLNETLETVRLLSKQHPDLEQNVSLLFFDSNHRNYKYFNTPASEAEPLKAKDYSPCGCTPLYDAIGESVGIERIAADYSTALFRELEQMIEREGLIDIFYERAFERLIPQGHHFRVVDTTDLFSIELDTVEDFERAKELIPSELY